jgi:DNA ligase-1
MSPTSFSELSNLCKALEATNKRKEKTSLLAKFLHQLEPGEVAPSVLLIVGSIFPEFDTRTLEVGGRTLRRILEARRQTALTVEPLTIQRVHNIFEEIAEAKGSGSRRIKENLLKRLMNLAQPNEVDILIRIVYGEMRIGVSEGIMLEGIAEAAGVETELVRRALMLTGDLGEVARIALLEDEAVLKSIGVRKFIPLKPMLAVMAYNISEVIDEHCGRAAFEYKFDGARIQIHRFNGHIRVYSRRLTNVTESLPDIVAMIRRRISCENMILEGEVIPIGEDGRPLPFQNLMKRFTRVHDVERMAERIPLKLHLFDILFLNGRLLIDESYLDRRCLLEKICPSELLAKRLITSDVAEVSVFLKRALEEGHEGLMAKQLDSAYTPGVRGKSWYKIKPVETLDLVIVAADWGSGRRTRWLSNYHLAARDGDDLVLLGKTFKGLTDEEFSWITCKLQELKLSENRQTVYVRPEVVVEVTFNEIQRSPQYRSGFALRFARISRIRKDKRLDDADTLVRVKGLYDEQFKYKARLHLGKTVSRHTTN